MRFLEPLAYRLRYRGMRKLSHAFCLVCNLAFGSSAAAGTVNPAPVAPSIYPPPWLTSQIAEVNYQLRLIRFVDRYWPAKAGIELPPKISTYCLCVPMRANSTLLRDPDATLETKYRHPVSIPI